MGQYGKISCPVCRTSIETFDPLEYCPVCKVYIGDKFYLQGGGTGITTANTLGEGVTPWGTTKSDST